MFPNGPNDPGNERGIHLPVPIELHHNLEAGLGSRFQPTIAMLEALDTPPDGLIVASPCNPAGTMLHPDELAALDAIALEFYPKALDLLGAIR